MKYKVTLDAHVIGNERLAALRLLPIPGTTRIVQLNPHRDFGKTVYEGYLEMYEDQKTKPAAYPYKINKTEQDKEVDRFEEALNMFFRFVEGGEGRDNCTQVTRIEPLPDEDEAKFLQKFDETMLDVIATGAT